MRTRVVPARRALALACAVSMPWCAGGCSIAGDISNKIAGRPVLPQMQAQQTPEAQATYLQRRRPMNNPPTDGDPRYSGDNIQAMQQMPAMQAGADQAGFPMGLPPAPQSPAAAWQGGTAVQAAPTAGFAPDPNTPQPPAGLDPYAAAAQQQMQIQQPQTAPGYGAAPGAPQPFPPQQIPYGGQQQPAYGMPQNGYPQPGAYPQQQGAIGGGFSGVSYAPQNAQAPATQNASYVPVGAPGVPGGPTGGNYGGGFDAASGSMPLQLDGGDGRAPSDPGGTPRGPALQSYGANIGAPWDAYNGDGPAAEGSPAFYNTPPAGPSAPSAVSNKVQDIPYAPRPGQQASGGENADGMIAGQNPLAAKSRLRYATRNRTSYYQSMMNQHVDMPSPYGNDAAPGGEMSY